MKVFIIPDKKEKDAPRILVAGVYDRSDANLRKKTGMVDPMKELKYRTHDLVPGLIIERNGRKYEVDAKGTQRRIE